MRSWVDQVHEATAEFRKGPEVSQHQEGGLLVTEVYAMPPTEAAVAVEESAKVDVVFMVIAVDRLRAEAAWPAVEDVLRSVNASHALRLVGGPSYIELAGILDCEQDTALRVMAIGEVLGKWSVMTPMSLGITGDAAREMAGMGFVMIDGFR